MREMLRIKRSVQATYNTQVNMMSAQMLSTSGSSSGTVADLAPGVKDGMRMLEAKAAEMNEPAAKAPSGIMFVRGETHVQKNGEGKVVKVTNPDEIEIDDDWQENDEDEDGDDGAEKPAGTGLRGGLAYFRYETYLLISFAVIFQGVYLKRTTFTRYLL